MEVASHVAATSARDLHAFFIPSTATDCEVRAAFAADTLKADSVLTYHDGEELLNMRFISVGYSRAGRPLWLKAKVDESIGIASTPVVRGRSWNVVIHGFVILYRQGLPPSGTHVRGMRVGESPLAALQRGEAVPGGVAEDAKSLAVFLLHACRQQLRADGRPFSFISSELGLP
jgi:hypothetical protein